uniref:Putative transcriptional regulator n=1 Tax=Desulfovibrio sp. U5L TaxID=596152 RepID=I2Q5X5_9BACT
MRIGELARRTGCRPDTVRFYEREGLLAEPARTEGNYRLYGATHLARLTFIRNCRALEMNLDEIRLLLAVMDGTGHDCGEVVTVLGAHIGHIADRIARLQALQGQLLALRELCTGVTPVDQCAIIKELTEPGSVPLDPASGSGSGEEGCGKRKMPPAAGRG